MGAIAGRHCSVPLLGCHCSVPLLGAIAACHCEKPWREKIDQSVTPFSAALFSALITHKNWLVLSGVYAGIILCSQPGIRRAFAAVTMSFWASTAVGALELFIV